MTIDDFFKHFFKLCFRCLSTTLTASVVEPTRTTTPRSRGGARAGRRGKRTRGASTITMYKVARRQPQTQRSQSATRAGSKTSQLQLLQVNFLALIALGTGCQSKMCVCSLLQTSRIGPQTKQVRLEPLGAILRQWSKVASLSLGLKIVLARILSSCQSLKSD